MKMNLFPSPGTSKRGCELLYDMTYFHSPHLHALLLKWKCFFYFFLHLLLGNLFLYIRDSLTDFEITVTQMRSHQYLICEAPLRNQMTGIVASTS